MPRINVIVVVTTIDGLALDLRRRLITAASVYGKSTVEYSVDMIDLVDDDEPDLANLAMPLRRAMALDGLIKKVK